MDTAAADLTRLTSAPPESDVLDDMRVAVGSYTGYGAASPLTAEIVDGILSAVAVAVAALVIDRASTGGTLSHQRTQVPGHDTSAAAQARQSITGGRRPLYAVADGSHDVDRQGRRSVLPKDGQMCALFAVDIVGFTRPDRDDEIRLHLHQKLYDYLREAFDDSGVPWAAIFCEDRGDGALIVIPPEISARGLIGPLAERLRILVRRHNHLSCTAADMQLRVAAHVGPVDHDGHGFVGSDVNFAFRMLEARPLKRLLAESGAELGLVVSDFVYESLICRCPSLVHPDAFRVLRFQSKNTKALAWTYLPGAPS